MELSLTEVERTIQAVIDKAKDKRTKEEQKLYALVAKANNTCKQLGIETWTKEIKSSEVLALKLKDGSRGLIPVHIIQHGVRWNVGDCVLAADPDISVSSVIKDGPKHIARFVRDRDAKKALRK